MTGALLVSVLVVSCAKFSYGPLTDSVKLFQSALCHTGKIMLLCMIEVNVKVVDTGLDTNVSPVFL